jgi:quinol monooxygenase YgiN
MSYVVSATLRAKPGAEQRLAEVLAAMAAPSRAEPGNRFYQPHRSADDPQLFYVYEQYADEAAYTAHQESEHYIRLIQGEAGPELLADRSVSIYEPLEDPGTPPA